ncbi:MAG: CotH kinase family protein [Verrucomicrobiota bacterium JB023]|nr:CotH kinase family protein [Verrucomicrobiota bacterium JB023]
MMRLTTFLTLPLTFLASIQLSSAQFSPGQGPPDGPPPPGSRGPGGNGGAGRPGGGPDTEDVDLVDDYDKNDDGWLNQEERAEARAALKAKQADAPNQRRRGGRGNNLPPSSPGPAVSPDEVATYPDASLYDPDTFRTLFLTFENEDWESELQDFKFTDVDVPAELTVDGKSYSGVGVSFRGASSYFRIPAGHKRSFNLTLDLVDDDQRLYGYKNMNLLNSNGDSSLMSTVLYSELAGEHMPVPKANFVKVVVNGEYWGVYVSVQQFDKNFTEENYGSSKGTRWKVPGSPRGDGGLAYDGDELAPYLERYDMKSNDGKKAWNALIELCEVLNETPLDQLEQELEPLLAIDETLWFLAYDIVLGNSDGYWTRASDYYIFRDKDGRFHIIPHDMNESFRLSHGRGSNGSQTDPLTGLDDARKPLRSRLLQVPALRERYLSYVREIAEEQLAWDNLGPKVAKYRELIRDALEDDTRKLSSDADFLKATSPTGTLYQFAEKRRDFILAR